MKLFRFFPYLLCILWAIPASAQVKTIKLKASKAHVVLQHYRISAVVDDREDTTNIGTIRAGITNKKTPVNLAGGAAASVDGFVRNYILQSDAAEPIALHIEQIDVSEKSAGVRQQADVATTFAFYRGEQKLIAYNGTSYVQTGIDATMYVEQLLREGLEKCLKEFDGWLRDNKPGAAAPKASVRVKIKLDTLSKDRDEIAFRRSLPLQFTDFQAEPDDLSRGAAATYSGIRVNYSSSTLNGKVDLVVGISAVFGKKQSWFRSSKTPATLAHEQGHFTITAVHACRLIKAVQEYSFSPVDYPEQISALQKEQQAQLDEMQRSYDKETNHGLNRPAQAQWEDKLQLLLREGACY